MECTEREGDGERTGAGIVFNICEGGESGADLVVWRGIGVGERESVSVGEEFENGMEDKRADNEG